MNQKEENKEYAKTTISWYPGHMSKTKKEIVQMLLKKQFVNL